MGIRQQGYWLKQSGALRRQRIADMAHAVGIANADQEDHQRAIEELELEKSVKDSRKERSAATWDMMMVLGGGKGV